MNGNAGFLDCGVFEATYKEIEIIFIIVVVVVLVVAYFIGTLAGKEAADIIKRSDD